MDDLQENVLRYQQPVEAFLYYEARLLDERRYDEWELLWDDNEALYWIPAGREDADPNREISYVYDNRSRLRTRLKQLGTGERHAQIPASRTQHLISNVEIREASPDGILVQSGFLVVESRFSRINLWSGKTLHRLQQDASGQFRIKMKKIVLINNDQPIPSMAFLL